MQASVVARAREARAHSLILSGSTARGSRTEISDLDYHLVGARRVVETGDEDGALVQVRTGLSLAAHAFLLALGEFPLSRAELPDQLAAAGRLDAAAALEVCIHGEPTLELLASAVAEGFALLSGAGLAAPRAERSASPG